jgi:fatty-acyl-CoA synthase
MDAAAFITSASRVQCWSYKTPRVWRFVDHFPQMASGKIQKFVLRDEFIASTA